MCYETVKLGSLSKTFKLTLASGYRCSRAYVLRPSRLAQMRVIELAWMHFFNTHHDRLFDYVVPSQSDFCDAHDAPGLCGFKQLLSFEESITPIGARRERPLY